MLAAAICWENPGNTYFVNNISFLSLNVCLLDRIGFEDRGYIHRRQKVGKLKHCPQDCVVSPPVGCGKHWTVITPICGHIAQHTMKHKRLI